MKTSTSHDLTIFSDLADELEKLVADTPGQPFFALPQVQTAWAKHLLKGELWTVAIRDEKDALIGFAAFDKFSESNQTIFQLVGGPEESDYLDILFSSEKALQVLLTAFNSSGANEVRLTSLNQQSITLQKLPTLAQQSGWLTNQEQQDICPVITLPKSWDEYLSSLSSSSAQQIKRALREVGEEDEISYELVTSATELPAATSDFIALHQQSAPDKAAFWTEQRVAFFQDLAMSTFAKNWLKLYFLRVNGERAAGLWIFDYDNQFLLYNSGFNAFRYGHLRVGTVLTAHTIQEAITLGRTRYDFMRGDEAYKFSFGAVAEPVYNLNLKPE